MRQKRIPVSCFSKEFQTKKLYIFSKSLVCCALDGLEHSIGRSTTLTWFLLLVITRFTRSSYVGQPGDPLGTPGAAVMGSNMEAT